MKYILVILVILLAGYIIFIDSCTIYSKEENKVMKDDCLSMQSERVFWSTHIDKENEFPLSLYIPLAMQKEIKMFDAKIKEIECLSYSMLFIHLNIDNGVKKLHYYAWDNDMKGYHLSLSDKDNLIDVAINTESIKKDMKIFEEIIDLSKSKDIVIDIENKTIKGASQIYLIIKRNQKIKRYGTYSMKFNRDIVVNDYAKYIQSILEKK